MKTLFTFLLICTTASLRAQVMDTIYITKPTVLLVTDISLVPELVTPTIGGQTHELLFGIKPLCPVCPPPSTCPPITGKPWSSFLRTYNWVPYRVELYGNKIEGRYKMTKIKL